MGRLRQVEIRLFRINQVKENFLSKVFASCSSLAGDKLINILIRRRFRKCES